MVNFKGAHVEATIILLCVPWYLAHPLSYRQLEEMLQERGVAVDHSTINRNGWPLMGAQPFEAFKAIIEQELGVL
jgi:transposase-like protein